MEITGEMHFAKALAGLRQGGVDVRDMTPDELYALAEASRRCADPFTAVNAELAGHPVRVSEGVWFWPPTVGATIWLREFAARWWRPGTERWLWAQAYALRHGREREAFAALTVRWRAEAAVLRCALTLPVRGGELSAAMMRAFGTDPHTAGLRDRPRPSGGSALRDFSALVARLEAVSGIPRETWLWERSLDYVLKAYGELHDFAEAAQGRAGGAKMRDELDEEMEALKRTEAAILRRVRGSAEREGQKHDGDGGGDDRKADREVAAGEAAGGRSVALDEHSAGQAEEEGVVGAGGSGGGVGIVHDGADCSTTGGLNQ